MEKIRQGLAGVVRPAVKKDRERNGIVDEKIIALITLLCVALCTLFSLLAPPPDGTPTSTGYRYEAGFEKAVGKYADFAACYEPSYLPAVPG